MRGKVASKRWFLNCWESSFLFQMVSELDIPYVFRTTDSLCSEKRTFSKDWLSYTYHGQERRTQDLESNRELFEAYNKDVYRTCYYMVHDAADAEDLTQDVFITVFRSDRQDVEYIKAWIMKITVNHCLNHLKRKRTLQQKVSDNLYLFKKSSEILVERLIEQRETEVEWAEYLSQLPVKLRMVITLRYMHDFSLAEISNLLSIPLGTTKSRLHKGLKLMKGILLEAGVQVELREGETYEKVRKYAEASTK